MIIGITGGIGSGKSRVANFWSSFFDHPLLDLDILCRQILDKEQPGWLALHRRFGTRFFDQDDSLDRAAFRTAIFNDDSLRNEVNRLLQPLARSRMRKQCSRLEGGTILIEIPLLFEAGWQQDVDRIVVVYADTLTRSRRIMARDGVSEQHCCRVLGAQDPLEEKCMAADHVIDNSGPWVETWLQVMHLGQRYVER